MAIPFRLPSDEETEDHYRRLEQLLADIYEVLSIILIRQQNSNQSLQENHHDISSNVSQQSHNSENEENLHRSSIDDVHRRVSQLPDLVLSTIPSRSNQQRTVLSTRQSNIVDRNGQMRLHLSLPPTVPPRKYKKKTMKMVSSSPVNCEKSLISSKSHSAPEQSWIRVGKELRSIAEEFRMTYKEVNNGKEPIDFPELKASSLFALLLPKPLRNRSVWTTVLFIVGWRMLIRQR